MSEHDTAGAPEPDGPDALVVQLERAVKTSYDNGYSDGRADERSRCPATSHERRKYPSYPPMSLIIVMFTLMWAPVGPAVRIIMCFVGAWSLLGLTTDALFWWHVRSQARAKSAGDSDDARE